LNSAQFKAKQRVVDALNAVDLLETRLLNVSERQLANNSVLIDACAYRIGVIGEAVSYAKGFSPVTFKRITPVGFTWDEIVMVRNQFYHEYNQVTATIIMMFAAHLPAVKLALANVRGAL
jgi:uncharacterized protein with HEPN domain